MVRGNGANPILYVGRNADNSTALVKGPDIVAENPAGQLVVVEVKGGVNRKKVNKRTLTQTFKGADGGANTKHTQPSLAWLREGDPPGERYLSAMSNSEDGEVRRAATRLKDVLDGGETYEAMVVASAPNTSWGKLDEAMKEIRDDLPEDSPGVTALRLDQPLDKQH